MLARNKRGLTDWTNGRKAATAVFHAVLLLSGGAAAAAAGMGPRGLLDNAVGHGHDQQQQQQVVYNASSSLAGVAPASTRSEAALGQAPAVAPVPMVFFEKNITSDQTELILKLEIEINKIRCSVNFCAIIYSTK